MDTDLVLLLLVILDAYVITMSGLVLAAPRTDALNVDINLSLQTTQGHSNAKNSPVPFRDEKTLAIVQFAGDGKSVAECTLYDIEKHPKIASDAVRKLNKAVGELSFKQMMSLIDECNKLMIPPPTVEDKGEAIENVTELWSLWRGIIPGTKWCGLGDEATSFKDIGPKFDVDNCCRSHDHCPIRIKPFRYDYGLVNFSVYTKSHCECDDEFLRCLKAVKTLLADLVGNFYFNVMQFGCMRESSYKRRLCDGQSSTSCDFEGRSGDSSQALLMEFVYGRKEKF